MEESLIEAMAAWDRRAIVIGIVVGAVVALKIWIKLSRTRDASGPQDAMAAEAIHPRKMIPPIAGLLLFGVCVAIVNIIGYGRLISRHARERMRVESQVGPKVESQVEPKVVEGEIKNLHLVPYDFKQAHQFTVHGIRFQYVDEKQIPGLRETLRAGESLRSGLPVRVHYKEYPECECATIVRLELKNP